MSLLRSVRDHVRGNLVESATLGALLAGAVALVALSGTLPLAYQVVLWGLLLAALTIVGRLFGPVLYYDLVRSARRLRFVLVRTLYALLVAFVLCWLFFILVMERGWRMPHERMSEFATTFFYTFLVIQYATVKLLTPAYTAGAIAEEKERKTLEFILATDLRNREIILGKVVSRLLNLSLLLLAGVPILAFLQLLGGVDFTLALAAFAATALTMYSLAGLSILNSVLCRRARDAIVLTYLMSAAYYMLASGALIINPLTAAGVTPGLADFPSTDHWKSPVELRDVVEWLNAGNAGLAVFRLGRGSGANTVLEAELPGVLGRYALFHGLAGTACLVWAMMRLRVLALRATVKRTRRKKGAMTGAARRPRVGRFPMIWKEVFAEGGLRFNALGRIVVGVLFLASFLPAVIIYWEYRTGGFHWGREDPWKQATIWVNVIQMRMVGTTVAVLMLLAIVVRAAGSIRSERERNTFDELLTTRLTNSEILFGKWLGAVLSVRWGWAWLGLIWLISAVFSGVQVAALPLILVTWVAYAAVGAGVGLWFSVGSKSALRATVAALATILFLFGGHWLLGLLFCYLPMAAIPSLRGMEASRNFYWIPFLQLGQTPPFVLGLFAYHGDEFERTGGMKEMVELTITSLFGAGCWGAMLPVLWILVKRRFEKVTGRVAELRPERVAPRRRRPPVPKKALLIDADPVTNGQDEERILTVLPVDEKEPEEKGPTPS